MGNSTSTQRPEPERAPSTTSIPSSRLSSRGRQRVPSLDLPDLSVWYNDASGRSQVPSTSQNGPTPSIPIPSNGTQSLRRLKRGDPDPAYECHIQPSTHIPLVFRDRYQPSPNDNNDARSEDQDTYQRSEGRDSIQDHGAFPSPLHAPTHTEPHAPVINVSPQTVPTNHDLHSATRGSKKGPKIVLLSSLPAPIRLEEPPLKLVDTTITWNGGGDSVMMARAGDDDWKHKTAMTQIAPRVHEVIIPLAPGTHHIGFLVDGHWRIADDLPRAVDDKGSLANYVTVDHNGATYDDPRDVIFTAGSFPINEGLALPTFISSTTPATPSIHVPITLTPGQSFWSTTSSAADVNERHAAITFGKTQIVSRSAARHSQFGWSSNIPSELELAAQIEEAYYASSQQQVQLVEAHGTNGDTHTQKIDGFIPLPLIPDPPQLPRHLDKLILNAKPPAIQPPNVFGPSNPPSRTPSKIGKHSSRRDKGKEREHADTSPIASVPQTPAGHSAHPDLNLSSVAPYIPPTIPHLDETVAADDASVLPVPSHVVLHHLTTSAIKNGVLAVGATIRYKDKYLTTVYYKPTDS